MHSVPEFRREETECEKSFLSDPPNWKVSISGVSEVGGSPLSVIVSLVAPAHRRFGVRHSPGALPFPPAPPSRAGPAS